MLGCLSAYQGAARLHAAFGNARHKLRHLFGYVLSYGYVVQEEQRLCSAADDVVDAHGNAVYAYGVVLAEDLRYALLGAHAVGAGDQYRLLHALNVRGEQPAEASYSGDHAGDVGLFYQGPYELDALVARFDIHACGGVRLGSALHVLYSFPVQQ